ncbi:retrovirus-related pol polyprotein from transposon TNT 1-94 [Tanacetum coccineum]
MNSVINYLTAKSTWDDLILYHEDPSNVKESRVIDLKLCYNTFKFKEGETLTKTFTRYKALMNEFVNDGIKLSKLEINTGFINGLPKKWLSFCQSLRNTNHVKDFELASLFGKLKYKENLIYNIYEIEKKKSHVCATPMSTAFFSTFIVQDVQDSPDDEEDTRSSQEYLNDLEEEYQARDILAKSKRFFKKGTQRFSSAKATDQTKCYKCGKKASKASMVKNKGLIADAYEWDEEEVSSDDNETVEVKVLMALAEDNDVISKEGAKNGEWVKIYMRKILKENQNLRKELKELTTVTETWLNSSNKVNQSNDTKVSIPGVERPWLSEVEGFILPNHDTGRILLTESQRNTIEHPVAITDSSATDYDLANESSVSSTPLTLLDKLDGAEPISGPKIIKSILKSKSTFKAEALKGIIINEPSSTSDKGNKSTSASKVNSAPAGKLKNVKFEDDPPLATCERTDHRTCIHAEGMPTMNMTRHLKGQVGSSSGSRTPRSSKHLFSPCIHCGFSDHLSNDCVNYPICDKCESYDHDTYGHNRIISLKRGIKPRNPQHVMNSYKTCGSTVHTTPGHKDIEWFRRGEALQAKALKSNKAETLNAKSYKTPTKRKPIWYLDTGCSRHMTGVKSYLHKYVEQPGPKVVFGDDFTCTTEGYGSIKCNGIVFTKVAFVNGLKYNLISISQLCDANYIIKFDEKRGTIFNSKKEVVMIAPRVRDVYVLDMTSSGSESCFFAKAFDNLNWLYHKRLAQLNFKIIDRLAKQNLVIGLPSLVYSKDKPCSACEKGKHHKANFKTKQASSIKKCLHFFCTNPSFTTPSMGEGAYFSAMISSYGMNVLVAVDGWTGRNVDIKDGASVKLVAVDGWTGRNVDIKGGASVNIMGEPLSPDRVFDSPVDELEPHPAYDFFATGPLPGYVGNPNNNNGWIEADVPCLGELGVVADEPMVGLMVDEVAEPVAEAEVEQSCDGLPPFQYERSRNEKANRNC